MPIRKGMFASSFGALPPSVTTNAVTNFNQDRATFNATVSANGGSADVYFDFSTVNTFASGTYTTLNAGSVTTQNTTKYFNAEMLYPSVTYYVRCRVVKGTNTVIGSTVSFTTWGLQVYERTTAGGSTFTIPTVSPTFGSPIAVSIYDIIMFGGGGGSVGRGGGGGGYVSQASASLTGSRSITTSVGAGGLRFGATSTFSDATAGGNTTITGDLTTLTANGGGPAATGTTYAGTSGNGYTGGNSATYNGTVAGPKDPIDPTNDGYGGGGGAGGNGGNGSAGSWGATGGNGGTGVQITRGGVTIGGGAGGGGDANAGESGTTTKGSVGAYNTYGSGGTYTADGQAGYIRFRYYAASAIA